ncbi:uncharacterized protein LOC108108213 isoform X2 [Drosophila eugracilis]|uniref:uncharacterized protein LOC108108213 isoform X2 n=1 Tax=Drosophila eugracilis TaxID=29029 RepID=UPI0007E7A519|nr:uncharacterized protein LOC108108213 isoform X2 [Drosophila eugracilis]
MHKLQNKEEVGAISASMNQSEDNEDFLAPTVREVQQVFAEVLSHGEDVTWDLQGEILKRKLRALHLNRVKSYFTSSLFDLIWKQRKFTNGQSLTSLFFVMIVDNVTDSKLAEQSRSWVLHPVFRCRRCVDNHGENNSSLECCMVYVNQYDCCEDWDKFLKDSHLPPGFMVTPQRGVYRLIDGQVELGTYYITGGFNNPLRNQFSTNLCVTPEILAKTSKNSIVHLSQDLKIPFFCKFKKTEKMSDQILHQLLVPRDGKRLTDVSPLSDSLVLFTQSVKNLDLASAMIKEQNCRSLLGNQLKSVFDKLSEEAKSFKGVVDLVRGASELPYLDHLGEIFKAGSKGLEKKEPKEVNVTIPIILIKGDKINLEDYGTTVKENILNQENFNDIITIMAEHLTPEMFRLILQFTQTFMETTRKKLLLERNHSLSTETVLYQFLLYIMKQHSNLDYINIKNNSSDILSRMQYFLASTSPNSPPEFLTKCTKCIGYYREVPV